MQHLCIWLCPLAHFQGYSKAVIKCDYVFFILTSFAFKRTALLGYFFFCCLFFVLFFIFFYVFVFPFFLRLLLCLYYIVCYVLQYTRWRDFAFAKQNKKNPKKYLHSIVRVCVCVYLTSVSRICLLLA